MSCFIQYFVSITAKKWIWECFWKFLKDKRNILEGTTYIIYFIFNNFFKFKIWIIILNIIFNIRIWGRRCSCVSTVRRFVSWNIWSHRWFVLICLSQLLNNKISQNFFFKSNHSKETIYQELLVVSQEKVAKLNSQLKTQQKQE